MRQTLRRLRAALADWIRPKASPLARGSGPWVPLVPDGRRARNPGPNDLLAELKATAFTCASINAAVCANHPPRLYVATHEGQPQARCLARALEPAAERRLRARAHLPPRVTKAARLDEVLDHPLLTLLQQVNPAHNQFDLWELTTLYQEVTGNAYWLLDLGPLGTPEAVWILPSQHVTPRRRPDSPRLVDAYEYRDGARRAEFPPDRVIHFRYPDPQDPYTSGLSPLRACYDQAVLASEFTALKQAKFDNRALPEAIVAPEEDVGMDERDRLEAEWNEKLRRGAGSVIVADGRLRVQLLNQSMGDLALLADMGACKEDIANAFHVPLAFLTKDTNLANLQASERQHMQTAIGPRLTRRDEKLNEQLVPLYDPTGRLFLASDDPTPADAEATLAQLQADLKYGILTINEVRGGRGLPPVEWGARPWLPLQWAPTDYERRPDYAPHTGRNRDQPREESAP